MQFSEFKRLIHLNEIGQLAIHLNEIVAKTLNSIHFTIPIHKLFS